MTYAARFAERALTPYTIVRSIAADAQNLVVTPESFPDFAAGAYNFLLQIETGVNVYSNSAAPALTIQGFRATDTVTFVNKGKVLGVGGASEGAGGLALSLSLSLNQPLTIDNTLGVIAGGGGGGGVGGTGRITEGPFISFPSPAHFYYYEPPLPQTTVQWADVVVYNNTVALTTVFVAPWTYVQGALSSGSYYAVSRRQDGAGGIGGQGRGIAAAMAGSAGAIAGAGAGGSGGGWGAAGVTGVAGNLGGSTAGGAAGAAAQRNGNTITWQGGIVNVFGAIL